MNSQAWCAGSTARLLALAITVSTVLGSTVLGSTVLGSTVLGSAAPASGSDTSRPNIVLFVCDDLSPQLGCYGDPFAHTPHIDALAAEGMRFERAFCTTASCSASRSVILTGLHNHRNGQYGHEHDYHHFSTFGTIESLPVRLSRLGYRTARVGKFHVAPESVYRFDVTLPGDSRSPVVMAENCREFIGSEDAGPFFLYYCTSDPHRGGGTVSDHPLGPDRFGNVPRGYPGITPRDFGPDQVQVPAFLPDTPTCRAELAQYYQSVDRVDQGLGRLVALLQEAGVYDSTWIVFTSDHGIAFPGAKTTLYEPGMRVPMIVRAPGMTKRDAVSDEMISLVDLTPTFVDVAGGDAAQAGAFHGQSFRRVVEAGESLPRDAVFASHTFHEITMYYPMRVVREGRFKLIWNLAHALPFPFATDLWAAPTWQDRYAQGPETSYGRRTVDAYMHRAEFELFDLLQDPDETENLADDPAHQALLERMQARLKEFQRETQDPWILKWDYE